MVGTKRSLFTWRQAAVVCVTGNDVEEFLQNYLTCDLTRLQTAPTIPMTLCNLKGRVVVSGWAHRHTSDMLDLVVHQSLPNILVDVLTPYARFSQCELHPLKEPVQVEINDTPGFLDAYHLHTHADDADGLDDLSDNLNDALVRSGFAWVTDASTGQFLPQVLNLHEQAAVDFDKGCYLGQEVVARAQFRGQVKKQLNPFDWSGEPPEIGTLDSAGRFVISVAKLSQTPPRGHGLAVK